VTVVTDQQNGAVAHGADDRSIDNIETYLAELTPEQCARIESVSMDVWPAYIAAVRRYVPHAEVRLCFDTFHIAKYVGEAVDDVRREEHRELRAQGYDWLTGRKHRWLQNPATMSHTLWRSFQ
jgi:transposase